MADMFDSPKVEVQKYSTVYLRYLLTLRISYPVRYAIEQEILEREK